MENSGITASDVLALTKGEDGFLGNGTGFIILILFFLMMGFGGNWGNNGYPYYGTTTADVQRSVYDNVLQQQLMQTNANISNAAYENARLINDVNVGNLQNINGLNMNMMTGFAGITNTVNTGFDGVQYQINNLAHQMEQCCCNLKSQMLEDKYDALKNQYDIAIAAEANRAQSQYILGQLGKFYPNPPYVYGTTI